MRFAAPHRRAGDPRPDGPRVVALGGGHGLAATLRALKHVTPYVTAIVTVADNGGSSGRLRDELGMLPPGDLRMALAALAGEGPGEQDWAALLQHRYASEGPLAGHAAGNLLLAALAQQHSLVQALDMVGALLGGTGQVLPAAEVPLSIWASVLGHDPAAPDETSRVTGQVAVATTPGQVVAVALDPADPPACPEAVEAILDADWVVLGPGSWFTSVLPHLLVPELRGALAETTARLVVTLNLAEQPGETDGFAPETHLEVLLAHAPELGLDVVLADPAAVADGPALEASAQAYGARLVLTPVAAADGSPTHDPALLAEAYRGVFATTRGIPGVNGCR